MFGFRFIKTQPTDYIIQYRNGRARRAGQGLAFWYFAPTSSLVLVPTASVFVVVGRDHVPAQAAALRCLAAAR